MVRTAHSRRPPASSPTRDRRAGDHPPTGEDVAPAFRATDQVENLARMADIFNELEEDLRRERIRAAWDKYGLYVLLLAVLIVVGTAGWLIYDGQRKESAAEMGNQFFAALKLAEAGDHAGAARAFADLSATAPAGYQALAGFQSAAQTISAGDVAAGVAKFDAIAASNSVAPVLRDLARLRAATALVDGDDRAAVAGRLAPLIAGNGPWANSAREMDALAAYRAGDLKAARTGFQAIFDSQTVPPDQAQRASVMISLINGTIGQEEAAAAPAAAKESTP